MNNIRNKFNELIKHNPPKFLLSNYINNISIILKQIKLDEYKKNIEKNSKFKNRTILFGIVEGCKYTTEELEYLLYENLKYQCYSIEDIDICVSIIAKIILKLKDIQNF